MNWTNVKLVLLREVRDQLRDRRTLFMIAILPLLLYPSLGIGMMQMLTLFSEQPRNVVILGADNLPEPSLVQGHQFVVDYFEIPSDVEKLRVVTDAAGPNTGGGDDSQSEDGTSRQELLATARQLRRDIDRLAALAAAIDDADEADNKGQVSQLEDASRPLRARISDVLSAADIQVLIIVPDGLKEYVDEVNRRLIERDGPLRGTDEQPRLRIIRNSADEKSLNAYRPVRNAVRAWEEVLLKNRLESADLPDSLPTPVNPDQIDLAQEEQIAATIWSKLFPTMLILMSLTGAFYPAIDLGAGEKERGTMETLLICPATRTEIMTGKFLTVLVYSLTTALLNLAILGLTGMYITSMPGISQAEIGNLTFPPLMSLLWVVVMAVPLSALFSGLSLGLAMFARSNKEGQYYLTPLLAVVMGGAVFCMSPLAEFSPFHSLLPLLGPALLLKALLLNQTESAQLAWYAVPVLITSFGYSVLGLWWAIEQFKREDVLFREAEQFEVGLWIKHLLRDKEPTPTFSEAGFCFVLVMLMQFLAIKFLGEAMVGVAPDRRPIVMMQLLLIQQLVIIATPALMMGVLLTTSVRGTFRLKWPGGKMLAAAVVLPFVLHPLTVELSSALEDFFPKLPERTHQEIAAMMDVSQPIWLVLLAFAVAPAICEELAFRGFILSGFARGGRVNLAIFLSAITFGVMHLIPHQAFNAALLGLVLGLLAVRSYSLFPGVIFHFLYNGTEVVRYRIPGDVWSHPLVEWAVTVQQVEGHAVIRYDWPLLVLCGVVTTALLTWLIRHGSPMSPAVSKAVPDSAAVLPTTSAGSP